MILRGSVPSAVLGMDTGITIVTPGTYHLENERIAKERAVPYKVAYLLHGLYGNNTNWADYTMLPAYANDYHMIFIMPEAARSFYTDMAYGLDYFTYVSEELPCLCGDLFRISADREDTYVIGGSMGGYGALKCALSKPDIFGHCLAFSSAFLFLRDELESLAALAAEKSLDSADDLRLLKDFKAAFGDELICPPEDDILSLADLASHIGKTLPDIYMLCGTEDPYLEENRHFSEELKERTGIPFSYKEIPGSHDWHYFDLALRLGLSECVK